MDLNLELGLPYNKRWISSQRHLRDLYESQEAIFLGDAR